jgi:cell division protein FtsB
MSKQAVTSKIGDKTVERIEEYAESQDISRSQAIEELTRKALKVEDKGEIVITDGGNQVERQLDSVESHLENQSDKIDTQQKNQNYLNLILVVSLVWIGIQLVVDLGALISAGTGIPLIAGIAYFYYQIYQEVNHE